jgi:hypothetical protein
MRRLQRLADGGGLPRGQPLTRVEGLPNQAGAFPCAGFSDSLTAAASEVFRGDSSQSGAVPFVNVTSESAGACPALLCKVRPAALASCNAYQVRLLHSSPEEALSTDLTQQEGAQILQHVASGRSSLRPKT